MGIYLLSLPHAPYEAPAHLFDLVFSCPPGLLAPSPTEHTCTFTHVEAAIPRAHHIHCHFYKEFP